MDCDLLVYFKRTLETPTEKKLKNYTENIIFENNLIESSK